MKILSIDGGGVRGLIPGMVIVEIEKRMGKPISELFDLISGTSAGGHIALALATPGADGKPLRAIRPAPAPGGARRRVSHHGCRSRDDDSRPGIPVFQPAPRRPHQRLLESVSLGATQVSVYVEFRIPGWLQPSDLPSAGRFADGDLQHPGGRAARGRPQRRS